MEWASLSEQERQVLVDAATQLPPGPYPDGVTEAALQQQQLHAVLTPLQPALEQARAAAMEERTLARAPEGNAGACAKAAAGLPAETLSEVQRKFLAGLKPYAEGKNLIDCGCESGLVSFSCYFAAAGGLNKEGRRLYAKLSPKQKEEVDKAIEQRKLVLPSKKSVKMRLR